MNTKAPTPQDIIARATAAEKAGRLGEAERLFRHLAEAMPKSPEMQDRLVSYALRAPGALPLAFPPLRRLLALAPKSGRAHVLAAQATHRIGQIEIAREHADLGVRHSPQDPEAHYVRAYVLDREGRSEEALAETEILVGMRPDHTPGAVLRARCLAALGRIEEAREALREIYRRRPFDLLILAVYVRLGKVSEDDPMLIDLRDRLLPRARKAGPDHYSKALQMLAKIAEDQGDMETAFDRIAEAKAANPAPHDPARAAKFVQSLIDGTRRAQFFGKSGSQDDAPVFVIGMPRSGSTLLEQILTGHPDVGGIGESAGTNLWLGRLGLDEKDGAGIARAAREMSDETAARLAADYLAMARGIHPDKRRIVDKFLHNFERLPLIARVFPKARILHARRDPMDNCLSCYMQPLSKWHSYTQDLPSLGRYYLGYRALMDHWAKEVPLARLDVDYETVVQDTEGQARRVIDFLGLDWDPACLSFQSASNTARTLSVWQVRQPIYKSSVQKWRRLESRLGPLMDELTGLYPAGF